MNIHYVSIGQNNRYAGKFAIQGRFGLQDGIPFPASRMFKKVLYRCETFWQFSLSLCAAGLPIKQSGFCSSLKARRSLLLALVTRCRKLGALGTTCRNMWTCFLHNNIYVCACVCVCGRFEDVVGFSQRKVCYFHGASSPTCFHFPKSILQGKDQTDIVVGRDV